MQYRFKIAGGDFSNAGTVASSVKKILRQLNIDHGVSKRIVIALYEAEVNVEIDIDNEKLRVTITDQGPGIPDIPKAKEEGFSTASPQVREMGFGAGMGLSNIKRNCDILNITSEPGAGTNVEMITYLKPDAR